MCGLVMLVTKYDNGFNSVQQDIFSSLLYLSGGFRGRDGTGVVVVDNLGNVNLAKDACSVDTFLQTKEFSDLNSIAFKNGRVMIGHNRAATRGDIKDSNSHPFVIDDKIIMVHNGTFYGSHKHIKDTEVDSEAIGHLLAENESAEEALKKVNAAYALMWYNVSTKTISVIRNNSRPLYYLETSSSYIYASDENFLKFVINKFNMAIEKGPYMIKEHNLSNFLIKDDHTIELQCIDLDCKYPMDTSDEEYWEGYLKKSISYYSGNSDKYYQDIFQKTIECLGKDVRGMKHGQWASIVDDYKENKVVAVEPVYWIEDNYSNRADNKSDYLIVGYTKDGNNLNASFKMYNKTEKEVIEAIENYNYTVAISRVAWRRLEERFPVDESMSMNEWMGVVHLQGYDPKPILALEHYVH